VRSKIASRFMTGLVFLTMILLLPAEADAQRRGGRRGGGHVRVSRPVVVRTYYRRPYYYRPYYYSPYWGGGHYGLGWNPYGWGYWPYGYGYYYRPYYENTGAARLQVSPKQTEVYVDGYFAGLVDDFDGMSQRLRLDPGEHEVELYLDGHRPRREKLMFTLGNTLRLRHTMEPLPAGEPPPSRPKPAPAPPKPAPSSADAPPEPYPARPRAGEPAPGVAIERDGRDGPRAGFGSVSIRVQPGDAEVLIDGEPWTSPDPRRSLIVQLSEGVHRVEIRKRGFTTYTSEVTVRRGETTALNVSLLQSDR